MPDPQKIGKYRILDRIARGGMGTIFRAHDPVLERPVALKVISNEIEVTDELRGRFFREAQACARLSHPNIVIVYEMGEDDGRLFIVMELLEGEEMRRLIVDRVPLAIEDKLSVMRQVCEGLHYAHERGIVHRDIKPGNIMRLRNGQVKILDFGIAQIANAAGALTRTGLIVGTLRYMAPEQVRGQADHRSDIYSIGAAFYEFLSLRPPFDGETAMQLLEQVRTEDPEPLDRVDPTIPSGLAAIIARAMRKNPEERFADLGQMRMQIEQVQRALAEEGRLVRDRIKDHRSRIEHLDGVLAARIGRERTVVPPAPVEPQALAALKTLEADVAGRREAAEAMVRQADALQPVFERALERLRAGALVDAVEDLEAIVTELPEHALAGAELSQARAHADAERRGRLAAKLVLDARAALRNHEYTLCLEILKQADEVPPPAQMAEDITSLREVSQMARSARTHAERARDLMVKVRSSAQEQVEPRYAPTPWGDAEAAGNEAKAAFGRGAYEEASDLYDKAAAGYRLFETAGREEQQRERDTERAHTQAVEQRQRALVAGIEQFAPDLWEAAESRLAEGAAAVTERSFARGVALFEESTNLFRKAEQAAKVGRQQQRDRAEEARKATTGAQQLAAESEAPRHAPALWRGASVRSAAAAIALEQEQYEEAAESFGRAALLYREAAKEAREAREASGKAPLLTSATDLKLRLEPKDPESTRAQAARARAVPEVTGTTIPAVAAPVATEAVVPAIPAPVATEAAVPAVAAPVATEAVVPAIPAPVATEAAVPAVAAPVAAAAVVPAIPAPVATAAVVTDQRLEPVATAETPATSPSVDAPIAGVADLPSPEEPRRRPARFGHVDDNVQEGKGVRKPSPVSVRTAVIAVVSLVVLGIGTWYSVVPRPVPGRPPHQRQDAAEQPPASPKGDRVETVQDAQNPPPTDTNERPKDLPERPAPVQDKQPAPKQPEGSARNRVAAEQARTLTANARGDAERAAASFFAPKPFASAQAKEKEGLEALARSDFPEAIRLLGQAKADYQTAQGDAKNESDAERRIGPLKASVEQAREATVDRRRRALAADAEKLSSNFLDAAEAKHVEADSLAKRQDFTAAKKAYEEASEGYIKAEQAARAGGAK